MIRHDVEKLRQMVADKIQHAFIQLAIPLDDAPMAYAEPEKAPIPAGKGASHSDDFACVNWYGTVYSFTRPQAEIVAALWKAWKDDCPFLSQQTLLNVADSDGVSVRDCFKGHPAWGTFIQHGPKCGGTLGTYRLMPPKD